jgi:hypothetical protein
LGGKSHQLNYSTWKIAGSSELNARLLQQANQTIPELKTKELTEPE